MTHQTHAASGPPRSRKLKQQSDNCLAIAIRERDAEQAALLIDEALKLATRAKQLGCSG